jgi:hypothetical protein
MLALLAGGAHAQKDPLASAFPLRFDSEWIRLYIVGDSLEVRGTYWLVCRRPGTERIPLFYPFPRDSLMGGARMVSVDAGRVGDAVEWQVAFDRIPGVWGVRWWVPPCTSDTIAVESVYRQKILTNYARYIVTTTKHWDRPLRRARFEIHLPPGAEPIEFSFPFTARKGPGEVVYDYEATEFLPDHDITVRWRK